MTTKALVIFSGQTDFCWQRFLRPGYRHCGVLVECGRYWLIIEPLSTHLHLKLLPFSNSDVPSILRRRGLEVVETTVNRDRRPVVVPGLLTCVEVVKRALGMNAPLVQTPWQLREKILETRKKNLEID